ncbi:uncharacterized protein LOC129618740 [Condylostylus longicornis]|uniref:uncharacterized protein LOC129618740 n=1 Tax=Condylostylus longicornis TaxID=2530218 RepID=UPI00244E4BAA|nr:uncharacterized protein LOC129618740 [Condylostylus longicornis]
MDKIIRAIKSMHIGYRLENHAISIICYADDAVLIAESENDIQRLLFKFQQTAEQLNMLISAEKTKALVISKDPIRCKLMTYNKTIKQVMSFQYLGAEISSCKNIAREVQYQANKASVVAGYLRDVIWKNKFMLLENKVRIYKTRVRPILTYSAETRAETSRTKQMARKTEMRMLSEITGYSLGNRIRSEAIREECNIQDVVRWTRSRRRYWRDHVERMPSNSITKIASIERPQTRRPIGRPPKRWRESWVSTSQE